jgi:uncharacterized membrane protein
VKQVGEFVVKAVVSGLLIALPSYLAVLLILKGVKSLAGLARPLAVLHPAGWSPAAEEALALLIAVSVCFALGVMVRSRRGRAVRERIETSVLEKIPGYALVRDLTHQLAGRGREDVWKPAFAEMGGGLVVAFIIEALDDERYTVFIPAVPSPFRGSVYILGRERVHPMNASFAQAVRALTHWGAGASDLVAELAGLNTAVAQQHDPHPVNTQRSICKPH